MEDWLCGEFLPFEWGSKSCWSLSDSLYTFLLERNGTENRNEILILLAEGCLPIGGTGFAFFAGKLRFYVGRVVPVEPTGKVPTGWEGF